MLYVTSDARISRASSLALDSELSLHEIYHIIFNQYYNS